MGSKYREPADGAQTTIRGVYADSPMGPRVGGTILIDEAFLEKYEGKMVEVVGNLYRNHEFRCKPFKKGEPAQQCFDDPLMRNVSSIAIVQ